MKCGCNIDVLNRTVMMGLCIPAFQRDDLVALTSGMTTLHDSEIGRVLAGILRERGFEVDYGFAPMLLESTGEQSSFLIRGRLDQWSVSVVNSITDAINGAFSGPKANLESESSAEDEEPVVANRGAATAMASLKEAAVDETASKKQVSDGKDAVRFVTRDFLVRPTGCASMPADYTKGIGTWQDIKARRTYHKAGQNIPLNQGKDVVIVITDTGIDLTWLTTNLVLSKVQADWTLKNSIDVNDAAPQELQAPLVRDVSDGSTMSVHGTMMAFDASIHAPDANILDLPIFRNDAGTRVAATLLSDAIGAYRRVFDWAVGNGKPKLIFSNSWHIDNQYDIRDLDKGKSSADYLDEIAKFLRKPRGCGKKYKDSVFVFAAGNCGTNGVSSCHYKGEKTIVGLAANESVLTVSACDLNEIHDSIASIGPGILAPPFTQLSDNTTDKPDFVYYSNFVGARLPNHPVDSATSAACSTAAGLVAAVWSTFPRKSGKEVRKAFAAVRPTGQADYDFVCGNGLPSLNDIARTLS